MKLIFVSNYLNHHQLPFCLAMLDQGVDFKFVATTTVPSARIKFGYADMNKEYDFVLRAYENKNEENNALKMISDADIVIVGNTPYNLIKDRIKKGKTTFFYCERLYKVKPPFYEMPLRALKHFAIFGRSKNLYLLCASAFTAADYKKTGMFLNKAYKWGYFPKVKTYDDIKALISQKEENTILWAGRFLYWKHPEAAVEVAKRLKEDGYKFKLTMVGNGEFEEQIKSLISKYNLEEFVILTGSVAADKVREYMEKSKIFLFTSDRNEGWGAVLNEAMNSGCAVVASSAIGSAPYLLNDAVNGYIYKDGNTEDLYIKIKSLLDNKDKAKELGLNAYSTLTNTWNADAAAERLLKLTKELLKGNKNPDIFSDGPCSKAEILRDNWYQ